MSLDSHKHFIFLEKASIRSSNNFFWRLNRCRSDRRIILILFLKRMIDIFLTFVDIRLIRFTILTGSVHIHGAIFTMLNFFFRLAGTRSRRNLSYFHRNFFWQLDILQLQMIVDVVFHFFHPRVVKYLSDCQSFGDWYLQNIND